jgi:hypothetical protein
MVLRRKYVLFFLTILIMALAAACGESKQPGSQPAVADNEANRTAAAKKYLEAMPPTDLLGDMAAKIAPNLPEQNRKQFTDLLLSKEMQDKTYSICLEGLVKHFTVGELNALTAFFGSPEGKAARKKFGVYMTEVLSKINQDVRGAMEKVTEKEPPAPKEPQGLKEAPGPKKPQAPAKAPGKPSSGGKAPGAQKPGEQKPAGQTPGK